jgi:hypothetical protein
MAPIEHHRSRCPDCGAELVHLVGDPSVPYEDIDPIEGGPRVHVEHTDERCRFHRFLTPEPGRHVLPGNANWLDKSLISKSRGPVYQRWVRTDVDDDDR